MTEQERELRKRAAAYLKKHGLTIDNCWQLNGEPPEDAGNYLNAMISGCFPADEDEVREQVLELIQMELEALGG